jgi:ubiquinone/menaquinone biosynthesis C-methylase UbiE
MGRTALLPLALGPACRHEQLYSILKRGLLMTAQPDQTAADTPTVPPVPYPDLDREGRFRAVSQYYENRAVRCWEITSRGHLHGGYWDETNQAEPPWAGPLRMTERMIAATGIGLNQRFIDFGSGLGPPALLLAQAKGCTVEGVNASQYQVDIATRHAAEQGQKDRVRFRVEDATRLSFPDASFDGGWFFESIFHMGHADALCEAHRVLKPGALLLITDLLNLPHTTPDFIALQHEVLCANHITADAYPALLADAGFELLQFTDLTGPVILAGDAKNRESFEYYRDELLEVADPDYLPFVEEVSALFAANAGYAFIKARAV